MFEYVGSSGTLRLQTTVAASGGCYEDAARIARLCYLQAAAGEPKAEVLRFRDELYKKCQAARSTTEHTIVCRNLFGQRVVVNTISKATERTLCPWAELEASDIDRLSSDDIFHYEKELRFSLRRSREDRLERLSRLAQKTTLPVAAPAGEGRFESLQDFLGRPESERCLVTNTELKRLERLAMIPDSEGLSIIERRNRLLMALWSSRSLKGEPAPVLASSFFAAWGASKV
eukprot:NODE_12364_length_1229_cov_3.150635.p2 GENE.NODE_12364_length_1229_cov_3.150635~~NODE_12364_length_1229_cov_3.150635.p2  ORF type:complete len:231 (-),score=57.75 NODE_12364_length_1229_cov_3.150635:204-896(-)